MPNSLKQDVPRLRRSARVLLFDEADELLLIRFAAPRAHDALFVFWVTPGGEVEPGELDDVAAARELHEELGIAPKLTGPVHEETGGTYVHLGETVRNYDVFFAARCARAQPHLRGFTAEERSLMQEARWFGLGELAAIAEPVFPPRLADVAQRALALLEP